MIDKIHFGRNQRTKCGIEKRSMKRYGTNFGYAITDKIEEVTCEKCKSALKRVTKR
jgi:hypothetical protein